MISLVNEISTAAIFNVLSIIVGCMISFPISHFLKEHTGKMRDSATMDILAILGAAVLGSVIPMGTYGIIPLVAAAYSSKFKPYLILPFIISNFIFNMSVPFNEMNFTWKTGLNRLILACVAGILAGAIAKIFSKKIEEKLFHNRLLCITAKERNIKGFGSSMKVCIEATVMFIVIGAILNSVFHRFIIYDSLKVVYSSSFGALAFKYMNGFNIMNPFFMLALMVMNTLMDITKLSALAFMFRIKGIALYITYFFALIFLLASSIYFM